MPRALAALAGAVLLLVALLLLMNARESEASAHAVTKACTDAARAKAEREHVPVTDPRLRQLLGDVPKPTADIRHCTYERRWNVSMVAFAGFALAGGLGFLAFGMTRQQVPA